jgi:two-component system alkaline phosphatase synthesis response regulator PhoP
MEEDNQSNCKILLVDDEPDILDFLSYNLEKESYQVFKAGSGAMGIEIARRELPQLIVLDVMMNEMDGIETCRQIRAIPELKDTVIAFLTARNEDFTQIAGFEVGADDYISKPIKPRLFVSKVKALLRRYQAVNPENNQRKVGDFTIDYDRYLVYFGGKEMILPKKEFKLLDLISSKPGKVFTREFILETVWGDEVVVGDRTIDVHIRKLREKFGEACIKTVKGVGYKFEI